MSDVLRSVIRTLSDSALYIHETLHSRSSSTTSNRGVARRSKKVNLAEKPDGSKYLSKLPVEIISQILIYLLNDECDLRELLLLNKRYDLYFNARWNKCTTQFLWRNVNIGNNSKWQQLLSTLSSMNAYNYFSCIRDIYIHNVTIDYSHFFDLTKQLVSVKLLSIENMKSIAPSRGLISLSKNMATMICLKEVNIYNSSRCIWTAMILIFQRSPFIQKISISGCDFNEGDLCSVVSFCPNLIEFNLEIPAEFHSLIGGDVMISSLTRHCNKVQCISLEGLVSISDDGLVAIVRILGPKLKKFQLKTCNYLTENGLSKIADCRELKKLTLSNIPSLNDHILRIIVNRISKTLEFLQLESVPISDHGIQHIANNGTSLKQLRLYDLHLLTDISFLGKTESRGLSKLKQLILHGSPALSNPKGVEQFGAVLLERLELVGCISVDENLMNVMIIHFSKLKRFIYSGPHASREFQTVNL
jgi:hypothetical protein